MSAEINDQIGGGGSSPVEEDPNAARKAELQGQIDYYNGIKDQLETIKGQIETDQTGITDNVTTPIIEPYDLSGGDMDWQGKQYEAAEGKRMTIGLGLGTYQSLVTSVIADIGKAIEKIEKKVGELQAELNSL